MLISKLIADVEARGGVNRAFQMILAASLLTNVCMAGAFFSMDRTVRTILVPPEINKSFWVDGRSIGPEYLEQMGSWVISQYATVTPASVDYQSNLLLKLVHPSVHGELAIRFKMGSTRLKAENMSKIFIPREVRISEKGRAIVLIGSQSTWIADKRIPGDEIKAYLVSFDYDGSRTYIKELRETSASKPFEQTTVQAYVEPDVPVQQIAPLQVGQESGSQQPSSTPPSSQEAQKPDPAMATVNGSEADKPAQNPTVTTNPR